MKKVSLKDIASKVGVAPSTVSFVLNGKAKQMRISDALTDRIRYEAEKAGYMPNQLAVSLRTGESKIIGLIVEDISNVFFANLARVVEREVEVYNYKVVFCSTENNDTKGRELIRMLNQQQVDGYLITPTPGMAQDINALLKTKKPVVLIDRYFPDVDVPYVMSDSYAATSEGMEHLIEKGYKKIAFVTVDLDLIQMNEREKAYWDAIKASKQDPIIFKMDYAITQADAVEKISMFLTQHPEIDAVFFATNYIGIAGLESIKNLGLSIPNDIAIICFDDHDIFRLYTPGITSLSQPIPDLAKTATTMLMNQLGKDMKTIEKNDVRPAAKLILRGST